MLKISLPMISALLIDPDSRAIKARYFHLEELGIILMLWRYLVKLHNLLDLSLVEIQIIEEASDCQSYMFSALKNLNDSNAEHEKDLIADPRI